MSSTICSFSLRHGCCFESGTGILMWGSGPLFIELSPSYLAEWSPRKVARYTVSLRRELLPRNGWRNALETIVR
jgi:hypothetical protein